MVATKWEGGEVRVDRAGRRTYWVRKRLGGGRFHFSLQTSDHEVALSELRRWRKDPHGFRLLPESDSRPVFLDDKLVERFLAWSKAKGNSPGYLAGQRRSLSWWAGELFRKDLRALHPRELHEALEKVPGSRHKIAAVKVFFAWLREELHLVTLAQDPTTSLHAPQARPEQWIKSKVIPREDVELVREHLPDRYRDALDVLAGTGWHKTELVRFAAGGSVEPLPAKRRKEGAAVLLCPLGKAGSPLRTIVSARVVAAARRLLKVKPDRRATHGNPVSGDYLNRAILAAVELVNKELAEEGKKAIKPFSAGSFRHTVATWAIEAGAAPEAVAAFLNHKSSTTTRRFYATLAAPPKVPTLR